MSKVSFRERSTPDTPSSGIVNVFIDTSGNLCWQDDAGKIGKIATAGSYTLTIPATGTAALLGTAQTFSAAQTFSNVLTAPGMKPASNSTTAIQLQNAGGTAILTVDTTNSRVLATALGVDGDSLMSRPAEGVVRQALESTVLAPDAVLTLTLFYGRGLMFVYAETIGRMGLAAVEGTACTLIYNGNTTFSNTQDTASKLNIYGSSTNNAVYIQNKYATSQSIKVYVLL